MAKILLTLLLALTTLAPLNGQDWSKHTQKFFFSHLLLLQDSEGFCTTFMVARNRFVTAAHCVMVNESIETSVVGYDQFGQHYVGTPLKVNTDWDIALVDLIDPQKTPVKFAKENPTLGTASLALGFTGPAARPTIVAGHVIGYTVANYLVSSPGIFHGFSGGPLINLNDEVVGLNVGVAQDGSTGYSIPLFVVQKFIAEDK